MRNNIVMYFHCKKCGGTRPKIAVGLTADRKLQVWCERHDIPIGPAFELVAPPPMACTVCGEMHGPEKVH